MKILDLFSGAGGMSLGFQRAGFEVMAAYENWKPAVELYERRFDHPCYVADLGELRAAAFLSSGPTGIIGGPPCQDFSTAGPRTEADRANLTVRFANIVSAAQPRFFVMENVPRSLGSRAWGEAASVMKGSGYSVSALVLDASLFGVPQKRKRLFTVGFRSPVGVEAYEARLHDMKALRPMTMRDYFGDTLGIDHYYRHPRNYERRGVFSMDEPAATVRGTSRPVPPNYPGHKGDTAHHSTVRALTTGERGRVQGFPPGFFDGVGKTNAEILIGNAVPVTLAWCVGLAVRAGLAAEDAAPHISGVGE